MKRIFLFAILTLCLSSCSAEEPPTDQAGQPVLELPQKTQDIKVSRFQKFLLTKNDLCKPISELKLHFNLENVGGRGYSEVCLRLIVTKDVPPVPGTDGYISRELTESQLVPYQCYWELRDEIGTPTHRWLAGFIHNRDGIYHTLVTLPLKDLKRSFLEIYFEDVDGDNEQDHWTFMLDMRDFDWESGFKFKQ